MSLIDQDCPCTGKNMKHFTAPWILLTLYNHEGAHGYKIKKIIYEYIEDLDIPINITGLYRHLNVLEKRGILYSQWDTSEKGPAKRRYFLTEAGKECLWHWMQTLSTHILLVGKFFDQVQTIFPNAILPKIQFPVPELT
jgi:DNA-binding PadR family transcriptional regulator